MADSPLEITFKTTHSVANINALLARSCRQPFQLKVEAHDRNFVPAYRILSITFANVDDRDRTMIALRQLDKESSAAA